MALFDVVLALIDAFLTFGEHRVGRSGEFSSSSGYGVEFVQARAQASAATRETALKPCPRWPMLAL